MKTILFKRMLRSAAVAAGFVLTTAVHAYTLPAVTPCNFNLIDSTIPSNLLCTTDTTGARIYVGSSHDDFISYGVNNLKAFADMGYTSLSGWSNLDSFGSGQIVKLFSYNNAQNQNFPKATGGTGDNDPKPGLDTDQTAKGDGSYVGDYPYIGSVTIKMLKDYLAGTGTSPVFAFDFTNNQTMSMTGYLEIKAADGSTKKTWSFDNTTNDKYDSSSYVTVLKTQPIWWQDEVKCAANAGSLCVSTVDNSVGGGKADFLGYAPDFNVNDWGDTDTLSFHWEMLGLDSAGEELALTKSVTTPTDVPEPSTAFLFGASLLGLCLARRKTN